MHAGTLVAMAVAAALAVACDKAPPYAQPAASEYTTGTLELAVPPAIVDTVPAAMVSSDFLRLTGVHAVLGRLLTADEFRQSSLQTTLISYAFWLKRFGGDPAIIGRPIRLNGQNVVIVGVLPKDFEVPSGTAIWVPRVAR
jgi:MacB-like protein